MGRSDLETAKNSTERSEHEAEMGPLVFSHELTDFISQQRGVIDRNREALASAKSRLSTIRSTLKGPDYT